MTRDEMRAIFERTGHDEDWEPIPRSDLHAFNLLNTLVSGDGDIIAAADPHELWLNVDLDALAAVITEEQVIELIRCGVNLYVEHDSLHMFV